MWSDRLPGLEHHNRRGAIMATIIIDTWQRWHVFVFIMVVSAWISGCDCGPSENIGIKIEPKIKEPLSGQQLSARVPIVVEFSADSKKDEVRMVEIWLTPQGSDKGRKIAELYRDPYQLKWNSYQVTDGYYKLHAVAFSGRGDDYKTTQSLVQVTNSPPDLWFVNCVNGQFIRGEYSFVVSVSQTSAELKAPPVMLINGQAGPNTLDQRSPYRFSVPTTSYKEGDVLEVVVKGQDIKGNEKRVICNPQVDNTPPTVTFTRPEVDGLLLGRQFGAEFNARDQFGVKEVRLWVDGSSCPADKIDTSGNCKPEDQWVGTLDPGYPIAVSLPKGYQTEQEILLTARAVDRAGNISEPARLRVRIDPEDPEIFIRSPGQGEVRKNDVEFSARITDNHQLKKVIFAVEGGRETITLLTREQASLGAELSLEFQEKAAISRFGMGKRIFVVTAVDQSGNTTISKREFRMGCGDSTDCPLGEVCHNSVCLVPAALNQPCSPSIPCAIGTICTENSEPFCSSQKSSYCRKRCHPGNKFVTPQPCYGGYFCDKTSQVCLPSDRCDPITNRGCASTQQCVLVDDDAGICYPLGNVKDGDVCDETCNVFKNCTKGSWCVFLLDVGRTACMKVCDVKNPTTCQSGQKCYALRWSFGGNSLGIGVCANAP